LKKGLFAVCAIAFNEGRPVKIATPAVAILTFRKKSRLLLFI
jgi:hypothetical protein